MLNIKLKTALNIKDFVLLFTFIFFFIIVIRHNNLIDTCSLIDRYFQLLSIVLFSHTYYCEIHEKRAEIYHLISSNNKNREQLSKIVIKFLCIFCSGLVTIFLCTILFYLYLPIEISKSEVLIKFLFSFSSNIIFWGTLSIVLVDVFRNWLIGIGTAITIWFVLLSSFSSHLPSFLQLFAFGTIDPRGFYTLDGWNDSYMTKFILAVVLVLIHLVTIKKSPINYKI